ncbi:MAG: DUF4258 domain-containing protein [Solirubrobacteraceae bacterium]
MLEPLTPSAAKATIVRCLDDGVVSFSSHALDEMRTDGITEDEVRGVLRGGVVEPAEFENGSWRYRVSIAAARGRLLSVTYAVVAFRSEISTIVVTAWRRKRR